MKSNAVKKAENILTSQQYNQIMSKCSSLLISPGMGALVRQVDWLGFSKLLNFQEQALDQVTEILSNNLMPYCNQLVNYVKQLKDSGKTKEEAIASGFWWVKISRLTREVTLLNVEPLLQARASLSLDHRKTKTLLKAVAYELTSEILKLHNFLL